MRQEPCQNQKRGKNILYLTEIKRIFNLTIENFRVVGFLTRLYFSLKYCQNVDIILLVYP